MKPAFYTLVILSLLAASAVRAGELRLLPGEVSLTGPAATQRLVVVEEETGTAVADRTAQASFTSSDEKIARVSPKGEVQAVGDGEAVLTAAISGKKTSAKVKVAGTKQARTPSFRNEVLPILTRAGCNSGACHGALAGKGGLKLSLRGYDPDTDHFVLTRQALGRRVDLQEPSRSLLLTKPTFVLNHGGGLKIEPESPDYHVLADWIASGAPSPKASDAAVTRLEVFPFSATLRPKDKLQVIVRAWHSDGVSRDVTRLAKFSSSEDLVAGVNENGTATVSGHGEASITVLYANLVATVPITSPYPNQLPAEVFAKSPRHNFIDDLVLKKLQALRLSPAPPCDDSEFIRRAFLDATGTLPTPEESEKFLADTRADKRGKLIDALLERPEYVDYWTHKWSDVLLVSTRKLQQPSVWAFYQHIRQNVADNKPWDRFARIAEDKKIDELETAVEKLAVQIIALRAPMADDLREVVAALKIAGVIEQIGDYAKNIAKRVPMIGRQHQIEALSVLPAMATLASEMLHDVLDAFAARDWEAAVEVNQRDRAVDDFYNSIFRTLLTFMMENPATIGEAAHLLFVAKNLERIGDHATNVAEMVYFAAKGTHMAERERSTDTGEM